MDTWERPRKTFIQMAETPHLKYHLLIQRQKRMLGMVFSTLRGKKRIHMEIEKCLVKCLVNKCFMGLQRNTGQRGILTNRLLLEPVYHTQLQQVHHSSFMVKTLPGTSPLSTFIQAVSGESSFLVVWALKFISIN